jgi:hypothetical protein
LLKSSGDDEEEEEEEEDDLCLLDPVPSITPSTSSNTANIRKIQGRFHKLALTQTLLFKGPSNECRRQSRQIHVFSTYYDAKSSPVYAHHSKGGVVSVP